MAKQSISYGWVLVGVLWLLLAVNMGFTVYGSGVINAEMAKSMALDRVALGGAFAIFQWMSGLPGPLVAMGVNRFGPKRVLMSGSLLLAIGATALALFVSNAWQFTIAFGVIVGLAAVIGGPLAAQAIIARWFTQYRARAMALMLTAPAIGGFIAPPLFTAMIRVDGGNWRGGWWLVAAGGLTTALLAKLLIHEAPATSGALPDGMPRPPVGGASFGDILKTPNFWFLILSLAGMFSGFMMFAAHGVIHLRDLGFTPEQAGGSFSLIFLALFAGNLLFAAIGDRFDLRFLLAFASLLMGAGLLLAIKPVGTYGLYTYPVLLGAGFGLAFSASMVLPSLYFGEKAYVNVIGIILAMSTTFGALGALFAGFAFDRLGGYAPAFFVTGGLCVFGAVMALLLRRPTGVESGANSGVQP